MRRFVTLVFIVATGSLELPIQDAFAAEPAANQRALTDAIEKLTAEVTQLRQTLNTVEQVSADPWGFGLPLTPAAGVIRFSDGKTREFVAIAGVHKDKPQRRLPAYFVFGDLGNGKADYIIPIDQVGSIRFGPEVKGDLKSETTVNVTYVDGQLKTYPCRTYGFQMDIRWADTVAAVERHTLSNTAFQGATVTIRRPKSPGTSISEP